MCVDTREDGEVQYELTKYTQDLGEEDQCSGAERSSLV